MSGKKDTNAGGVVAGFIYQIYYFLYRLLKMQEGEIVSLEKFEDVGSEVGQEQTYYQLKHTIASKGTHIERMRDRDTDLWKTLSMWIDKIEKQGDETAQMEWIRESEFVLISNKTTEMNTFFQLAEAYKNEGRWEELKNYIAEQATKDSSGSLESKKNIRAYIRHVNDFCLLSEFLKRVKAEPMTDEDIVEAVNYLLEKQQHMRKPNAIITRETIYGRLSTMLLKGKVEFTMDSFDEKFGELFRKMRIRKFVPTNKEVNIPEHPYEQTFIRQLCDIDDVRARNIEDVKELTYQMLRFRNDYENALAAGDGEGGDDQRNFERDVKNRWKNHFLEENDGLTFMSDEEQKNKAAKAVVRRVRNEWLKFDEDDLNSEASNGCFYYFSDGKEPRIGWRVDWESLYNGKEWTID